MKNNDTWKQIKERIDPLNLNKGLFEYCYDDPYEIPIVYNDFKDLPYKQTKHFIGFNEKPKPESTCHFFLHDYQFERVWNQPKKYLPKLSQYETLLTPDFSLFTDYPMAVQIWNTYRNRWLGCYWQDHGYKVIPTIVWSTPESFDFCFNGVEKGSTVAISTLGCLRNKDSTELFMDGYNTMIDRLSPSMIILYGEYPTNNQLKSENIIQISNSRIQKLMEEK